MQTADSIIADLFHFLETARKEDIDRVRHSVKENSNDLRIAASSRHTWDVIEQMLAHQARLY